MYDGNLATRLDREQDISSGASDPSFNVADFVKDHAHSPETRIRYRAEQAQADLYSRVRSAVEENIPLQQAIPLTYDKVTESLTGSLRERVEDCCRGMKAPTYNQAMKYHEVRFLNDAFEANYGNIAQSARRSVGETLDTRAASSERKQIYRLLERNPEMKPLLDGYRPQVDAEKLSIDDYAPLDKTVVETTLKGALTPYQSELLPAKYQEIEASIGQASGKIADTIAQYMPTPERKLDEFIRGTYDLQGFKTKKEEFERQFLSYSLERNDWDVKKTAEELEMNERNLKRRIDKLEIGKQEAHDPLSRADTESEPEIELSPEERMVLRMREIAREKNARLDSLQAAKRANTDDYFSADFLRSA